MISTNENCDLQVFHLFLETQDLLVCPEKTGKY